MSEETVVLKDGTEVEDPRLDRLVQFDERSRNFAAVDTIEKDYYRAMTWPISRTNKQVAPLDQGQEGACVGFSVTHELLAFPAPSRYDKHGLNNQYAREQIYWPAQRIDPWAGGAYPGASPQYEGTSVLAGVQTAHSLGWMESYLWAFGLHQALLTLSWKGPLVLGTNWYSGMYNTDSEGFLNPTGSVVGGHAYILLRNRPKEKYVMGLNSWGGDWGQGGYFKMSYDTLEKLLGEQGEAVYFHKRKMNPQIAA